MAHEDQNSSIAKRATKSASKLRSLLYAWLPLLFWLAVIAFESTSTLSTANTGKMFRRLVLVLFGVADAKKLEMVHALLRKSGHFAGYAILSLLFFRALVRTVQSSGRELLGHWRLRLGAWAVLAAFVIASLDEWHQSMLPARTGCFNDVLLNTAGAMVCQFALVAISARGLNDTALMVTTGNPD